MPADADPFTPGFGQFQGIPQRTLPDDCMEYTLLAIDRNSDQPAIRTKLQEAKRAAEDLVREWTAEYIWQRDGLQLELANTEAVGWHLRGRTEYGDSVDDEWLIVWLLRELGKKFSELWVRVYDTDGEFLLIEAANTLPRWLNPEIADNRVWMNASHLHIIPPPTARAQPTAARALTLPEAYSILTSTNRSPAETLQCIRLVEEEAFYRLRKYPQAITSHLHYAQALIPRTCAMVLHVVPEAIAAAVESFYLRDPISLKALKSVKHFTPGDMVSVSVKFTKVLYAQLKSQEFEPPVGSGFGVSPLGAEAGVGMKLACGFEMLAGDDSAPQISSSAVRRDMVRRVRRILRESAPPTDEEISTWPKRIDGEEWLDIDYEEFDRNLSGKDGTSGGGGKKTESGWGDKQAEETLKKMVKRFEAFLNDEDAGAEGAEVDDMDIDDDDDDDDDEDDDGEVDLDDSDEDKEISFDEAEFSRMMREMMGMPPENAEREDGGGDEEAEIRKVMSKVEEELKEAGAIERGKGMPKAQEVHGDEDEGDDDSDDGDEGDEVNIDYTLAKNMLESFKGQSGLSGPGGNLLARMGIILPRDGPGEDEGGHEGKGKQIQS